VAFIESLVPVTIAKTSSSINYLFLAVTLLIVGIPIWLRYWLKIEKLAIGNIEDRSSNTRRIFLLLLFGISSLVAVVSLIYVVFNFVISLLENEVGLETLRQTRFALGILLVTLLSAFYHWTIYQDQNKFVKK
jgi:membrane protease YdiL (CAAX protease family)